MGAKNIAMPSRGDEYMDELKSTTEYTGVHPQKFALWVAMASMTMFFAALTSALILKKGDFRSWENFKLPVTFLYSTLLIVGVSVCMHLSLVSYRRASFAAFRWLLFLAFALGVGFLFTQWQSFLALTAIGKPLTGNIAGQFVYLIASLHGLHIVAGLGVTAVALIAAIRARKDELFELRNIINPKRKLHMELLVMFWHYIDIVWVYLYVFFYLNYQ
jgi:cytochrome c oxidase subunit III